MKPLHWSVLGMRVCVCDVLLVCVWIESERQATAVILSGSTLYMRLEGCTHTTAECVCACNSNIRCTGYRFIHDNDDLTNATLMPTKITTTMKTLHSTRSRWHSHSRACLRWKNKPKERKFCQTEHEEFHRTRDIAFPRDLFAVFGFVQSWVMSGRSSTLLSHHIYTYGILFIYISLQCL